MVATSQKVGDIIAPIARDLAEFERKVLELERTCAEFRRGVQGLAKDLRDAGAEFSPAEAPSSADQPETEIDPPGVGPDATAQDLARIAGLSSRIETKGAIMVVRRPGGTIIPVMCELTRELSDRGLTEPAATDELREKIRGLLALPAAPDFRERFGAPVECVVLFVPCGLRRDRLFDRLPGIREEASAAGVVIAPPAALYAILRNVAGAWLRFSCSGNVRSLVDKGQDLVDELSAFISFFTDNEKALCEAVESYARESRAAATDGAP